MAGQGILIDVYNKKDRSVWIVNVWIVNGSTPEQYINPEDWILTFEAHGCLSLLVIHGVIRGCAHVQSIVLSNRTCSYSSRYTSCPGISWVGYRVVELACVDQPSSTIYDA